MAKKKKVDETLVVETRSIETPVVENIKETPVVESRSVETPVVESVKETPKKPTRFIFSNTNNFLRR